MTLPSFLHSSKIESLLTGGVESFSPATTPIAFGGMSTDASPAPARPSGAEVVRSAPPSTKVGSLAPGTILDALGNVVPISAAFNPAQAALASTGTWQRANAALNESMAPSPTVYEQMSYTGSNLKVMIEVANPEGLSTIRLAKQLIELTTITVSAHRVKCPAVAMGFINAKGWARGRRTIAGTLVLTKFTKDVLAEFLTPDAFTSDLSKDSASPKVDQLPPFNLTLLFGDEYGHTSFQRLLGVELVTSGDIYSIQDMYSEQTISYVAADFTPLLPYTQPALNPVESAMTKIQRTVGDVLTGRQSLV